MFLIFINIVKLIQATREYSKQISNLMLKDLNYPNSNFPCDMIIGFREHAKQENIEKADFLYLANIGGYVGQSAATEMGVALINGVPVVASE